MESPANYVAISETKRGQSAKNGLKKTECFHCHVMKNYIENHSVGKVRKFWSNILQMKKPKPCIWEHRDPHLLVICHRTWILFQVFVVCFISYSTVYRHVIFGCLSFAFLVMDKSWWITWLIYLQRLLIGIVAIDFVLHLSRRFLF